MNNIRTDYFYYESKMARLSQEANAPDIRRDRGSGRHTVGARRDLGSRLDNVLLLHLERGQVDGKSNWRQANGPASLLLLYNFIDQILCDGASLRHRQDLSSVSLSFPRLKQIISAFFRSNWIVYFDSSAREIIFGWGWQLIVNNIFQNDGWKDRLCTRSVGKELFTKFIIRVFCKVCNRNWSNMYTRR